MCEKRTVFVFACLQPVSLFVVAAVCYFALFYMQELRRCLYYRENWPVKCIYNSL